MVFEAWYTEILQIFMAEHVAKTALEETIDNLTKATKKRATALPSWMAGYCIHVFLIAMRSAKWLVAERIPINNWADTFGRGRARHLSVISSTCWGEKLGWVWGREVAYTEWTSTPPFIANPVASSNVNP
jgi:hypothetical protein